MNSGEWGGTMALPEAGSDVGNLKTKTFRKSGGSFRLRGTKQFIKAVVAELSAALVTPPSKMVLAK
jgi:alkylation response protein AidB-like acyl-CoA dehydrogenase